MTEAEAGGMDELVVRTRSGDAEAFSELVRMTSRPVYAAAVRIVGDAVMAEDISQEAFFRAWKSVSSLKTSAAFGAWVRTIAVRLAFDEIRLRAKIRLFPDGVPDLPSDSPSDGPTEEAERRRLIMSEIARLDKAYAEPLILVDLEGMAYEDAAGIIGITLDNLKVRLHRARGMLRDRLAGYGMLKSEDV